MHSLILYVTATAQHAGSAAVAANALGAFRHEISVG